ncbi:MAG TPA: carbohydrate binding family 9 domain-containing protein, partial [Bacteroidota bacterium]
MTLRRILPFIPFLVIPSLVLHAGSGSKTLTAVRTPVPPTIDGVLAEPEWTMAATAAGFVQYLPLEGQSGTQPTEVRILFDDDALYIGATMFDSDPSGIVARLARRDDEVESDWFSVRLDSYHDHQTAFEFTVNAAGIRTDILISNDGREEDASWDAVWESEVAITPQGWSVELRIPFKVLRFSDESTQEWGIQFIRYISRLYEIQHWVLLGKSESGHVSKFGHLEGQKNIRRP